MYFAMHNIQNNVLAYCTIYSWYFHINFNLKTHLVYFKFSFKFHKYGRRKIFPPSSFVLLSEQVHVTAPSLLHLLCMWTDCWEEASHVIQQTLEKAAKRVDQHQTLVGQFPNLYISLTVLFGIIRFCSDLIIADPFISWSINRNQLKVCQYIEYFLVEQLNIFRFWTNGHSTNLKTNIN